MRGQGTTTQARRSTDRPPQGPAPQSVLLVTFVVLIVLHSVFTPAFEAPDEVWHYAYVRWIAEGNGLPPLTDDRSGAYQEAAQPPLYYLVAAAISSAFSDDDLPTLRWHNPGFGYQAPGTSVDNKNMLVHPWTSIWPHTDAGLAVHVTRITSWLFGLAAVAGTWALCWEALRNRRWALVGAALVAFQPQFVFISGVVSNDSAAAAVAAVGLYLGVRLLRRGARWQSAALAGVIAGLGALTKTSLLPLMPLLGLCLIAAVLNRTSTAAGRRSPQVRAIVGAGHLGLFVTVTLSIAGWWYLRNWRQVGDPLGLSRHTATLWGRAEPATVTQLVGEIPLLVRSFWGAYGWGHVTWPTGIYAALAVGTIALLGIAGIRLGRLWQRGARDARDSDGQRLLKNLPTELVAGLLAAVWLVGIALALFRWMLMVEAPHGRLLFPALSAWAILTVIGLRALSSRYLQVGRIATAALVGAMAVLSTLAPGARILATFAPPRLRSVDHVIATCDRPLDVRFGAQARLICAEADPERVEPGDTLEVTACWTAVKPIEKDYSVFVHLLGPQEMRVAERNTYPGLGRYPTSLWQGGGAFCDRYELPVAAWADAPLAYRLEIGLFDAETGDRLEATVDGLSLEPPVVGSVVVAAPPSTAVPPERQLTARFGPTADEPVAQLVGVMAAASASPGSTVPVTLTWEALSATQTSYVAFVHLWRPGDASPLAQHDAPPRQGWYPTPLWQAGDRIPDEHPLQIPGDLEPGVYPLWAGLYRAADALRLPAHGPTGRYEHDLVPIGSLEIH